MNLAEPKRLPRAAAVRFILPDRREITVAPPSLQQAADCLRLDPRKDAPPETQCERVNRLHQQAVILLGPAHASLTRELVIEQVVEMVQALYLAASGLDPTRFVEYQHLLRKKRDAEEVLSEIDRLTIDLAAELRQLPGSVAQLPLADAVSLQKRLAEKAKAEARFDAALHGKELR